MSGNLTTIDTLALEGHDSELFSFLHADYREQLENHPNARKQLFTLGEDRDGMLYSVPMWNSSPSCFAWTSELQFSQFANFDEDGWISYHGFVTKSGFHSVEALVLIRYLFSQSYTCALNDYRWIKDRADPQLERLRYIRGWFGKTADDPEWMQLQAGYFGWCLEALELIPETEYTLTPA